MKGQSFESPRGPVSIDPATRDIVQNIYVRRVERSGGQLWNTEFETVRDVKDPGKANRHDEWSNPRLAVVSCVQERLQLCDEGIHLISGLSSVLRKLACSME